MKKVEDTKESKTKKKEPRPKILDKIQLKLWLKAGGRCQYRNCNENLYEDKLTFKALNKAYIAHIYGYAPNSARYDAVLSPKLETDFSNLMLLCDGCHRKVDREEKNTHSASLLLEMKKEHEDRIENLTSFKESVKTNVVFYNSKIGNINPPMEWESVQQILIKKNLYPVKDAIILAPENTIIPDGSPLFWQYEAKSLEGFFKEKIEPYLKSDALKHFSLFPFGTMPLLIKLGTLFGDKYEVTTYQLHREPRTWEWQKSSDFKDFRLIQPDDTSGIPVLNISLSANIDNSRILNLFPEQDISIWTLTHDDPNVNFLQTEEILTKWRIIAREVFSRIKDVHGHNSELHIFPAMPLSASVEFGRVWNPKVDLPIVIYDGRDVFNKTIEIKRS
jgi:5-methylcytosine-specific restriction endonuclease McrA